ncbi:MAG TPA: sigma-70 family RNA polymerase sigma factor [Solirubrobacterales bacterium]|nr:sigma-70 family RNA polymerase sigma factor [Solirubrobacterales bacterium]
MSEAAAEPGFARLLSDERLTRRAVGGDERAFAAIFRRYHQSLYRFCLAIVGNPEDAQDALQNTMIKVLRALPGEERRIELKPWLYRIAHNESIDLLRRRRETRELDVEQIAPGYGLAEDAVTRERLRRLIADLKELPERQREVLVMRELSGLDFDEIGAALETSGAVARQTLYEARQSLRQMEEGREMSCATVTRALSDGDGRVTRRRDVRAHLRACPGCRAFRDEIAGRRQDLAALAPLPLAAAAGMLHGLLGTSQGATSGGGLAATLGGGAAKTIGASAAAKGVATAAVVAAIGVTAADRTGVIHLGLPGEENGNPAKQAPATPGSAPGNEPRSAAAPGSGGAESSGNSTAPAAAGTGEGVRHHRGSPGSAHAHQPATDAGAHGKAGEHASGKGHEKQYPPQATKGQETAAAQKPPPREHGSGNSGGKAAAPPQPSHPSTPTSPPAAPPKEAPATAPAATPEAQPEVQPPVTEKTAPEAAAGAGNAPENIP